MTERDKRIIRDIERFRALNRDQIATLHFSGNKQKIKTTNFVLKRLKDKGYIRADENHKPYVYLPYKGGARRGSQKVEHFIAIANVYLELRRTGKLRLFNVEPKLGEKGTVEPDAFSIWRGWPWFIEVQISHYSDAIMRRKLKRYERYYLSGEWRSLDWQPKDKKPLFPILWILSNRTYDVSWLPFKCYQTKTIEEMLI